MSLSASSTVPIHGNYHGYYTKRAFLSDERLAALPVDLFHGARVLDVGCNEGWVTCEIAQYHGARAVVGVDIDDTLIQAAWRRRIAVWSTQAPTHPTGNHPGSNTEIPPPAPETSKASKKRKRPDPENESPKTPSKPPATVTVKVHKAPYFPASCEHEFGPLPIPPSAHRGKTSFPHNISFRAADWTKTHIPEDAEGYGVVIAFSISKWIHLNEGDEGLKMFFQRVYDVLKPGGSFVLEPQPWESYAKAKRMNQKLKENAKSLTIRPTDFESILTTIGFSFMRHFGFIGEGGFNRPIDLYTKL